MKDNWNYYRVIVANALLAFEVGDAKRAQEILEAGSRGEAIKEDPQRRTLEYCEYRTDWPRTETVARG